MRGSRWEWTVLQCKLASGEEANGLEIKNLPLSSLSMGLQYSRGRKPYVDCTREPPPDSGQAPAEAPAELPEPAAPEPDTVGTDNLHPDPYDAEMLLPSENHLFQHTPDRRNQTLSRARTGTPDGSSVVSTPSSVPGLPQSEPVARNAPVPKNKLVRRGKRQGPERSRDRGADNKGWP